MARRYSEIVGSGLGAARDARGWSQARPSAESGVPQAVISAIERGVPRHPPLDTVGRLCAALDAELIVEVRPARVVGRLDQRDPAHAACSGALRRLLRQAGWLVETEVEFVSGRWHGFVDLLAFDAGSRRLLVAEVKTELRDIGGLERQIGWYLRESRNAAARLGWRPVTTLGVVVLLATAAADGIAMANRSQLAGAFPARGRAVRAALFDGAPLPGRGLVMLDPGRRGAASLVSLAVDGRRTSAPYRDYAGFVAAHMAKAGHGADGRHTSRGQPGLAPAVRAEAGSLALRERGGGRSGWPGRPTPAGRPAASMTAAGFQVARTGR